MQCIIKEKKIGIERVKILNMKTQKFHEYVPRYFINQN